MPSCCLHAGCAAISCRQARSWFQPRALGRSAYAEAVGPFEFIVVRLLTPVSNLVITSARSLKSAVFNSMSQFKRANLFQVGSTNDSPRHARLVRRQSWVWSTRLKGSGTHGREVLATQVCLASCATAASRIVRMAHRPRTTPSELATFKPRGSCRANCDVA